MTIAVVAALPAELAPIARRLACRRPRAVGAAGEGRLDGRELTLWVTGAGAGNARRGLAELLSVRRPELLLGIGAAGGLCASLGTGDLLVADNVIDAASRRSVGGKDSGFARAARRLSGATPGTIVSAPAIAYDAEAKARLARLAPSSPAVVDLESAVWAELAEEAGVASLFVRGVTDGYDETLPLDFERYRDSAGGIDSRRIVLAACRRPAIWPRLLELRRRLRWVAEQLARWTVEAVAA